MESRQNKIRDMWRRHKDEQIKDLVICIDYKFRLIGKLFSDELRIDLEKHKSYCMRNKKVRELKILSDILYLQNIEIIESQLQQIVKQRRSH